MIIFELRFDIRSNLLGNDLANFDGFFWGANQLNGFLPTEKLKLGLEAFHNLLMLQEPFSLLFGHTFQDLDCLRVLQLFINLSENLRDNLLLQVISHLRIDFFDLLLFLARRLVKIHLLLVDLWLSAPLFANLWLLLRVRCYLFVWRSAQPWIPFLDFFKSCWHLVVVKNGVQKLLTFLH